MTPAAERRPTAERKSCLAHANTIIAALIAALAVVVACSGTADPTPSSPPTAAAPGSPATVVATLSPALAPTPRPTHKPLPGPTVLSSTTAISPTPRQSPAATPTRAAAYSTPSRVAVTRGGTLNLVTRHNTLHQDIHQEVSPALSTWGPGIVYSRLLRLQSGPDVELPSLAVECELCESWKMEDNTTLVFRIRGDALWHDVAPVNGRRLTPDDIAFSYERQRQPGWPNAGLLAAIERVEAPSPDTLRISLSTPDADFIVRLADGHSKVAAREAVQLNGDLRNGPTIGSGPWILGSNGASGAHAFERNLLYFEAGLPLVDAINMQVISDAATRNAAFRVGAIDVQQMEPEEWEDFSRKRPNAPVLRSKDAGTGLEVAFKTTAAPFDDALARRAAFRAMNPWRAVEEVWLGSAFVSLGMPPARADWLLDDEQLEAYFGDVDLARKLARQVAADAPLAAVVIKVGDFGERYEAHARLIADELKTVGFEPTIEKVNRREFAEEVWLGGDYQMFVGPIAPVTTPNGYLLTLLHSQGRWNTTEHRDEVLDALIEAQAQEFDAATRKALGQDIQTRAFEGAYRFMPAASVSIWTWWPRVRDFHPNFAGFEYSHWAWVWLEE